MGKGEVLLKIIDKISTLQGGLFKSICIWVLVSVCFYWGTKSDYFMEKWQVPKWNFIGNEYEERMISDIELASGSITMCPQIVVKYQNEIVYIINVIDLYDKNYKNLSFGEKDEQDVDNKQFVFYISDGNGEKLDNIISELSELIQEQLDNSGIEEKGKIEVYGVRLAKVIYQNKKANQSREMYVYISSDSVKRIIKRELRLRCSENVIELEKYDCKESVYMNTMILEHVQGCIEKITD